MKKLLLIFFIAVTCACTSSGNSENVESETGSESNESTALAFVEVGDAEWSWQDGEWLAEVDSGSGFLITDEVYKDFEFSVDFMPDSTINSGIFIRCTNQEISAEDCYEFNIWDKNPNQEYRTGGIVFRASPLDIVETIGKWNTYRIVANGSRLEAWVNEVKVMSHQDSSLVSGHLGLQALGTGKIRFKNISLQSTTATD